MLKSVTITCTQTQRLDWQHPTFPSLLGQTHFLPWFILGNFVCLVKKILTKRAVLKTDIPLCSQA